MDTEKGIRESKRQKKTTSSAIPIGHEVKESEKSKFGGRILKNDEDVFEQNAWDHAEWGKEQQDEAELIVYNQMNYVPKAEHKGKAYPVKKPRLSTEEAEVFNVNASEYWNSFYSTHQNKFFKERNWLSTEFPEIFDSFKSYDKEATLSSEYVKIMEIGCGTGSTVYPLLRETENMHLEALENNLKTKKPFIYACDFAPTAVNLVMSNPLYDTSKINGFVYDLTNPIFPDELNKIILEKEKDPEKGLDFILAIYVLSAIKPSDLPNVIKRLYSVLNPGGILFFRDYGKYDLAQLRMNPSNVLGENFYRRGDGTQVYFFDSDELQMIFEKEGFKTVENSVDRRLLVNRKRKVKMYRVWLQAKFMRPIP